MFKRTFAIKEERIKNFENLIKKNGKFYAKTKKGQHFLIKRNTTRNATIKDVLLIPFKWKRW